MSPKASAILTPIEGLDLYGNFGYGYHSNDARGVVAGVTPMTQALAYETGARITLVPRVDLRLDVFRIDLQSELVWVGDEGTTEPRGRTRREGIEADLKVTILPWLWADVSATLARARFRDEPRSADSVPLAPRRVFTGQVTAQHPRGAFGRLSLLHVGSRPATEDRSLTAQAFTRVDASAGYRFGSFELALAVENLLDAHNRDAQFAQTSRLRDETSASSCGAGSRATIERGEFRGCEDLHFTPGTPLAVRASASVYF